MTEFAKLKTLSALLGSDPELVQAAGGNTSIKRDGVMWIKASGTWLKDAQARDIFVPLDLLRLETALGADDPACEACTDFVRTDLNPLGLRPSIETSVHGLMPQRVVLHVHCVNTIAYAVQANAEALLAPVLKSFDWAFVPYARPGLMLSRAIKSVLRPGVDVLVLGNHGLAVAAETVAEAEKLLRDVVDALRLPVHEIDSPRFDLLQGQAAGTSYRLPADDFCHAIALGSPIWARACAEVFYPDHVVFLGTEIPQGFSKSAPAVIVPGAGVLVHETVRASVEPMLRCLGDVFRRVPANAILKPLTEAEVDQLLNWDAEKYRQTLSLK